MRRRFILILLIGLIPAASCVQGSAQINPNETLDAYLTRTYKTTPSVAVSVVHHGVIVYEKGFGIANRDTGEMADAHTRFLIASVTKQITAMAVMMLKESGRLQYDSPVTDFVPEYRGFGTAATIRNLLQHTAGFPAYDELCNAGKPMTNADVIRFVANRGKSDFAPGSRHSYSDTGYSILAEVVARVSGMGYSDFIERRIFEPLGMKESFVTRSEPVMLPHVAKSPNATIPALNCNTVVGDGGIYSSAHDLALWNQFLERNTIVGTTASMDEAYQPTRLVNGDTVPYGFGWRLSESNGDRQYSHTGSWMGFSSLNSRLPGKQISVVVLANQSTGDMDAIVRKARAENPN